MATRANNELNLADLNLEISFLFLKIEPSRSGFADTVSLTEKHMLIKSALKRSARWLTSPLPVVRSVLGYLLLHVLTALSQAGTMISQKVFDPRFGLGAGGVVGREDARCKVLRAVPRDSGSQDSQCGSVYDL